MADFCEDTICAISTPPGESGIGLIRLSGPQAVSIAQRVFRRRPPAALADLPSHTIHYGLLSDPWTKDVLDEVLLSLLRAPRTYTREDMVEIGCHGGPVLLQKGLDLLVRSGARPADPGEFTRRAFLNGRIDLTQAEAVMELISARTESGARAALRQLQGDLGREVRGLYDGLLRLLAQLEADIDFSEEDLEVMGPEQLRAGFEAVMIEVRNLLSSWEEGRILREGLVVAIAGRPNVGKSSLLNALLQSDRAIVTPVPGTTRDVLEEWVRLGGLPLRAVDMAGVRRTRDPVEMEGIRRALAAVDRADLVLIVLDASRSLGEEDRELIQRAKDKKKILVLNKADLIGPFWQAGGPHGLFQDLPLVKTVATRGEGLEELKERIQAQVLGTGRRAAEGFCPISTRHKAALEKALGAIERAALAVDQQVSGEFVALELRAALDALGEVVGLSTTEDLLDRIFSQFCIGK